MSANLPIIGLHPDYLEAQDEAAERAIKAYFDDAVEDMLNDAGSELPLAVFSVEGTEDQDADDLIDSVGLPTKRVDTIDKWVRVLMLCKLSDADLMVQGFRDWAQTAFKAQAKDLGINARALELAQEVAA